jgi:anaerobic selenocysteine-containing dehydrogenase
MSSVTEIRPSVCPLDCPDTCSLNVTVKDNQIVEVKGSKSNAFTAGVVCNKVARAYTDFVHGPTRLTHPLKRTETGFERISWDDALDLVHRGFQRAIDQNGPESILPLNYAGPHGELAGGSMDRRFFYQLGATLLDRKPLCGGVRAAAYSSLFGNAPGMSPLQLVHSDLIMIWGTNVTVSNLHLMRVLNTARRNGAKVVVIDPKRIKVAEQCDLFVQIKPGTDVVLALALAAELEKRDALDLPFIEQWVKGFDAYMTEARRYTKEKACEISGIAPDDFDTLVEWLANAANMATAVGVGIERSSSGGASLRAAMSLNALTGQHGRIGAGVVGKVNGLVPKTTAKLQGEHLMKPGTRSFNIVDVAEKLLDREMATPVHAVMIYNHNPVATHPDQSRMIEALSQDDVFVIGCDVVMTESMALCDVILPAVSHFEHDDVFSAYGHHHVQRAAPVIPYVGEGLPNTEIFRRLAAKFGFDGPEFVATDQELIDDAVGMVNGSNASELVLGQSFPVGGEMGEAAILCDTVPPGTPSGKIELESPELAEKFGCAVPQFRPASVDMPLQLITPSSSKRINATFGGCALSDGLEELEMHPVDATARGLADGDEVSVWNARGKVVLHLRVTDAMQPGVVYSPKGAWCKSSPTGQTTNALISADSRCDLIRGAAYNDTFVEVTAA